MVSNRGKWSESSHCLIVKGVLYNSMLVAIVQHSSNKDRRTTKLPAFGDTSDYRRMYRSLWELPFGRSAQEPRPDALSANEYCCPVFRHQAAFRSMASVAEIVPGCSIHWLIADSFVCRCGFSNLWRK